MGGRETYTWSGVQEIVDNQYLSLRNFKDYRVPFARINFSERLPYHSFPKAWNDLKDTDIRDITCKKEFRFKLKEAFLDNLSLDIKCKNPFCRDCFNSDV